jgi:adenylate cyclase
VDTAGAQLYLAASYAALGEVKNASMAVTRALELDPQASIERYTSRDMAQYQVAADLDHFRDYLRKAGLPETSSSSLARMDEKPSIAVLPFANLSGDPQQDYFAEGIAEDITTELSRFRQFKIQARTAAALFHGSEADALNAGRELGVRYFVSGSVRRLGQRLRISTQLVDAETGNQVWAERFDRSEKDLFAVQDEVIRTIVSTLAGRAEAAGAEQTKRRHPGSLGAYECVLRAETLPLYDHKSQIEARSLYEKAIGLDPDYARPHAMLANLDVIDWMEDMSGSDAILDRALELAKKSVVLDDNDATCQMTLGAIYSNLRSFQLAGHHYQRAMDLNRNNPLVVATVGTLHLYRGDAVNAVKVFEEARILDPFFEPSWYWPTLGIARFALDQYHEAIALLERSPNRPHWVTAYLAASFALIGEEHRASQAAAETQRTLPSFLPERFTAKEWPPESDTGKKLLDGLRKAGLPETSSSSLARMDERPSIAVLPFVNLSGDPQLDYFSDGITEDIITELSRFKGLFVIARNSAFSFKTKSVAIATIAKGLGVRFLLEGSVRRSGDRVRMTTRLVDAETGREAWAERYDRVIEDIFEVQDDVVRTIVATLEGQLATTVADQSRRQTPSNILAYECVLQARKFLDVYEAHSAEPLLRRAIAADGRYAQAHAWMAMVYWVKFFNDHQEKDITEAVVFGKTAVALDPGDSVCHMQLGFAYIFARQLELADIHSLKALELNPADMLALGLRAQLLCRFGRSQEAIEALDQLVRHDPFPPNWYWENRSIVLLTLDKFEDALTAIQHMPELFWWNYGYVAICCAGLGRLKEGQDAIKRAIELCPELTIQRFMKGEPYKLPEDANRMIEGLRRAGLPEHVDVTGVRS